MLISAVQQSVSVIHTRKHTYIHIYIHMWLPYIYGFQGGASDKEPAYNEERRVWSQGQEDPLEEGMATHSSIVAWRIPWTEEPGRLQSTGSQRVGHDWSDLAQHTHTHTHTHTHVHSCSFPLSQDIEYGLLGYTIGPCYLSIFSFFYMWGTET